MVERQKVQQVAEVSQLAQTIAALEAAAAQAPSLTQIDSGKMFRESSIAVGAARWLQDEAAAEQAVAANSEAATMRNMIAAAPNIAQVVDSGVNAAKTAAEIPMQAEPGFAMLPAPV